MTRRMRLLCSALGLAFVLINTASLSAQSPPTSVTIIHAWGITNPAPFLYGSPIAPPRATCAVASPTSCWQLTNDDIFGAIFGHSGTPDVCWTNTAPFGPYDDCSLGGTPCHDSSGNFPGQWHAWIHDWWLQGWLPSIGVSPSQVRKAYVIYNTNDTLGGPAHYPDCGAVSQLQAAIENAYANCDTHVIVTTHSNGGVTFLRTWRSFIEGSLAGLSGDALDSQRLAACQAQGLVTSPPLFVNAHLMQAAVGDGQHALDWLAPWGLFQGDNDFFPIQPYDTIGKTYWEPADGSGNNRAILGVRFYYNHEDVMTYDLTNISPVGRNVVLGWLDGTLDGNPAGADFWFSHSGVPPYAALHACGHTSEHSASMNAENSICGDLIVRFPGGITTPPWQDCSTACSGSLSTWYDSTQGPATCLNPCHRNCWGPTALASIQIRDPAVFPDKYPFSFGNPNLQAMGQSLGARGWLENSMRLDWTELYDRQVNWCSQQSLDLPQERPPDENGRWPKYGQLIPGRNDSTGEVTFP